MKFIMWELRRRGGGASLSRTSPMTTSPTGNCSTPTNPVTHIVRDDHHGHPSPSSSERKRLHKQRAHFLPLKQTHSKFVIHCVLTVVLVACGSSYWLHHLYRGLQRAPPMYNHNSPRLFTASSHRMVTFIYQDGADKQRIEGVAKIEEFQREWNMTDSLPQFAMTTPKFLRNLNNSRDYRQLGEPVFTEDCEAQYEWQSAVYPTCNVLHEFADLTALTEGVDHTVVTKLIANGFWRDVWVMTDEHGVRVVKTLRYKHKLSLRNYDRNRRDAMAMEHLTSSKYIVDIYGYCSAAGLFEYSSGGDISNAIWPEDKSLALTPIRKLQIATQGAMALAVVHNSDKEGQSSIAHTDIGPDQFILIDGRYKLNDFNRCRFLLKFRGNATNCPYFVGRNPGKNRSPEEYRYDPQTEKVDVYSYGNIIYSLLMEELPFADERSAKVPDLVMEGVRPTIFYDIWNSTDPIVQALKDAMIWCHENDLEKRASARELEVFLKSKLEAFDPGRLREWGDV